MLISYKRGQGSIVLRVKILNSSVSTGAGLTGLTSASSGLIISTIADNEATATAYTVAGSTIETITTLGTYAAPTATKCRFKEVDATNHKGVYEIQIADARFAVSSARSLLVSISGATNAAETDAVIPLTDLDPYDSVRAGLTALPNAAANANGGLPVLSSSGTTLAYTVSTITTYTGNTPQTGDSYARIGATGSGLTSLAPSATALSTATWTGTLATNLGTLASHDPGTTLGTSTLTQTQVTGGAYSIQSASCVLGDARIANLDATISSRGTSTLTQTQVTGGAYSIQSSSCVLGDTRIANLDATVSSRGTSTLTQTQVTGGAYSIQSSSCVLGDARVANLDAAISTRSTLDAAGVRTAVGLASANLDTQFTTITTKTNSLAFTTAGKVDANVFLWNSTAVNSLQSGRIDAFVGAMDANTLTASALASDAVTEIQSGLATSAALATVAGYLDTEIAAILEDTGTTLPAQIAALNNTSAADVWGYATRVLTAGTNIALAKGTGVTGFTDIDAAGVRTAVGLASANLDTQLDALPTAAENAAGLLDAAAGIETGLTVRQGYRLMVAALAGKLSGAATTTITIRNVGDSKDRIVATVDSDGNRSAITTDLT